jgi:hypothetical protein
MDLGEAAAIAAPGSAQLLQRKVQRVFIHEVRRNADHDLSSVTRLLKRDRAAEK